MNCCDYDCHQGRDCPVREDKPDQEVDTNPAGIGWVQDLMLAFGLAVFTALFALAVGSILFWVVTI